MKYAVVLALSLSLAATAQPAACKTNLQLAREVRAAETAFAHTMGARDLRAFVAYVSTEAIFVSPSSMFRGREAVRAGWKRYFESAAAPFSWEPEMVEVLDSGRLALSTGPVRDPDGHRIGTFNSIWRRERDGRWRVVFDKGCPVCDEEKKP